MTGTQKMMGTIMPGVFNDFAVIVGVAVSLAVADWAVGMGLCKLKQARYGSKGSKR